LLAPPKRPRCELNKSVNTKASNARKMIPTRRPTRLRMRDRMVIVPYFYKNRDANIRFIGKLGNAGRDFKIKYSLERRILAPEFQDFLLPAFLSSSSARFATLSTWRLKRLLRLYIIPAKRVTTMANVPL